MEGTVGVGLKVLGRLLDGGHDVGKASQVKHPVHALKVRRDGRTVANVGLHKAHARFAGNGFEVLQPARHQAVQRQHLMALGQQQFAQVGADEASAAGDQGFHGLGLK